MVAVQTLFQSCLTLCSLSNPSASHLDVPCSKPVMAVSTFFRGRQGDADRGQVIAQLQDMGGSVQLSISVCPVIQTLRDRYNDKRNVADLGTICTAEVIF